MRFYRLTGNKWKLKRPLLFPGASGQLCSEGCLICALSLPHTLAQHTKAHTHLWSDFSKTMSLVEFVLFSISQFSFLFPSQKLCFSLLHHLLIILFNKYMKYLLMTDTLLNSENTVSRSDKVSALKYPFKNTLDY